ncbi:MAG: hypothetical protein ACRC2T_08440, partial [Thermoguttaceae bacterium]
MTCNNFHTTRWSVVLAAKADSPDRKTALKLLCETYYQPVLVYIERTLAPWQRQNQFAKEITHD